MEKMITNKNAYETFSQAFRVCFFLYFIFNTQYGKEVSTTMEMVQRYMFKLHPDSGTKSKKISSSKRKVISLITKLKNL